MSTLYFAYGSNMASERLRARVPSARPLGAARLDGFGWHCNQRGADGTAKANLAPEPGAETWGVLFEIDPQELPALDRVAGGYERQTVEVAYGDARLAAHTYVSTRIAARYVVAPWYLALVLRGAREHGLPPSWVESVAQRCASRDGGDPGGSGPGERMRFDDDDNHCFGCSPRNPRGLGLSFERIDRGVVETRTVATPDLCGMGGVVHGGVQAAMLDEAMGFAVHAAFDGDQRAEVATVELKLRYRRPTPTGEPITLRAEFVRAEGRDVWVRGEIRDASGRLCTEADSRWRRVRG